jgi:NAD(P)H-dependent flavin oxidoreductase YrpB (nitropropane dioxygenase family)
MLHTRICDLLGIAHPIVMGGMASHTSAPLVAAVSNAGGLGILGVTGFSPFQMHEQIGSISSSSGPAGSGHCAGKRARPAKHFKPRVWPVMWIMPRF